MILHIGLRGILLMILASARFTSSFVVQCRTHFRPGIRLYSSSTCVKGAASSSVEISIEDAKLLHGKEGVTFLDGSWWLPTSGKNGRNIFEEGPRIAGARFFDIDDIATKDKNLPHMMPPAKLFNAAMDALNITNDHNLIVYGQPGCPLAYRTWYQIWAMGHDLENVSVLHGSVQEWANAGGPTDAEPMKETFLADDLDLTKTTKYTSKTRSVVGLCEMKQIIASNEKDNLIVDVRSAERFFGKVEEPRPGLRLGHMPGAKNFPFADVLDPANIVKLKSKIDLVTVFDRAGLDWRNENCRIVASCGSGASACVLAAALIKCGRDPSTVAIYDGSWVEWGGEPDTPITTD